MKSENDKIIDEIMQAAIGDEKYEILDTLPNNDGGFVVRFQRPGGKIQNYLAVDQEAVKEFTEAVGGVNIQTVAAKPDYLKLNGWGADELMADGHRITKIRLEGGTTYKPRKVFVETSAKHGVNGLPDSKAGAGPIRVNIRNNNQTRFTRSFKKAYMLDNLVELIKNDKYLSKMSLLVKVINTENVKTKALCVWRAVRAGDGTKRMVLKLVSLNGKHYTECLRQDLHDAADGMADTVCRQFEAPVRLNTLCEFAVRDGKVGLDGKKAA